MDIIMMKLKEKEKDMTAQNVIGKEYIMFDMSIPEILFMVCVMYGILLYFPTYYLVQYMKPHYFQTKAQQKIGDVKE